MTRPAIVVAQGYKGNPDHWCFWDEEFPDDRTYGPFESKEAALISVKQFVSWEDTPPPVRVLESSDSERLFR